MRRLMTILTGMLCLGLLLSGTALAQQDQYPPDDDDTGVGGIVVTPSPTPMEDEPPGVAPGEQVPDPVSVVNPPPVAQAPQLARTGLDLTVGLVLAFALLLAGMSALILSRRRSVPADSGD